MSLVDTIATSTFIFLLRTFCGDTRFAIVYYLFIWCQVILLSVHFNDLSCCSQYPHLQAALRCLRQQIRSCCYFFTRSQIRQLQVVSADFVVLSVAHRYYRITSNKTFRPSCGLRIHSSAVYFCGRYLLGCNITTSHGSFSTLILRDSLFSHERGVCVAKITAKIAFTWMQHSTHRSDWFEHTFRS